MLWDCGQLTDDVHLAEVQADFGEGGDASSTVVSSTVAIFSSRAIGWTLGGVIEPGKTRLPNKLDILTLHFHGISSFTENITLPGVRWSFCNENGFLLLSSCLPEAKDLWKILPFTRRQGDVLPRSLCLHSSTEDLRRKKKQQRSKRVSKGGRPEVGQRERHRSDRKIQEDLSKYKQGAEGRKEIKITLVRSWKKRQEEKC